MKAGEGIARSAGGATLDISGLTEVEHTVTDFDFVGIWDQSIGVLRKVTREDLAPSIAFGTAFEGAE